MYMFFNALEFEDSRFYGAI